MGNWRKLGQICEGLKINDWATDFAAVPTAVHQSGDTYRIYVSARDSDQRSRPAWFDFDLATMAVRQTCTDPILPLGSLGCFDDSGVMPTWILHQDDGDLMYYIGWNQGITVPFRNSIGLARQARDGRWEKCFPGPIVDRTRDEPHFTASCAVLQDQDSFHMWYLSCTGWRAAQAQPQHQYHIKYATSSNAIDWDRNGHVAIDYTGDDYAISRPSVLREADGQYRMWFSARGDFYQIYEACSYNAKDWEPTQAPVLTPSDSGWDAEMVCYPFVFQHNTQRYMLYNGNGYGRSGVGLAIWEG